MFPRGSALVPQLASSMYSTVDVDEAQQDFSPRSGSQVISGSSGSCA